MSDTSNSTDVRHHRWSPMLAVFITLGLAVQPITSTPSTPDAHVLSADRAVDHRDRSVEAPRNADGHAAAEHAEPAPPGENTSTTTVTPPTTQTPVTTVPVTTVPVATVPPPTEPASDPFAMITSPDVGDHCADGLSSDELTDFFSEPIGALQGADYQRAFRLTDDRVLWTFQDAFIAGTLVHNVGVIQSGRCFTLLNAGARSWLFAEATAHMQQWHWILDGGQAADGTIHMFVVQMNEQGSRYLTHTQPTQLRRVILDPSTLQIVEVVDEQPTGEDLYGWAVTSDATHTYLYSHCYRQFGHGPPFGAGACAADVKLARVPLGNYDAPREYWDGQTWTADHVRARPVVDGSFVFSGNNPAQIRFDGDRFLLVEKRDDWWGTTIEFGVADQPYGPFRHVSSVDEPLKCDRSACNTYFAAWLPWVDPTGAHIWSIGHNRWNGEETSRHLGIYRPTFHSITL